MRRSVAPDSAAARADLDAFAGDVHYYLQLSPRQLPSRYLYDALGSALFEAICELPWYPITRAERTLLSAHGGEMLSRLAPLSTIVELGPGSGDKLVTLVSSGAPAPRPLSVHLVDVSASALDLATRTVSTLDDVEIVTHQATYESGLADATSRRRRGGRLLALFLGSNIGNFDPPGADAFLRTIRGSLAPGDVLLLGTDLVKPERALLIAYDDPLGVTAAFNRNLLVRVNRELGGNFDLDAFTHRAVWNTDASRVEMHLVSTRRQRVHVPRASAVVELQADETIWTESSYKYEPDQVVAMLARASFGSRGQWIDAAAGFALTLAEAE
jgi:L-histidine N-alpha-methyltransferase